MLSDQDLDAIEERCSRVSPGPWLVGEAVRNELPDGRTLFASEDEPFRSGKGSVVAACGEDGEPGVHTIVACHGRVTDCTARDVAAFIASSREDVPKLLEEVKRLRQTSERVASALVGAITRVDEIATATTDDYEAATQAALHFSRAIQDAVRELGPHLTESTKTELQAKHSKSLTTLRETLRKENARG